MIQWCFQSDDKKENSLGYEMKAENEPEKQEMEAENKERKPPSKVHEMCCEYDNSCVTQFGWKGIYFFKLTRDHLPIN